MENLSLTYSVTAFRDHLTTQLVLGPRRVRQMSEGSTVTAVS